MSGDLDRRRPRQHETPAVNEARQFLIHEDAHILVFNKPSGLAVQGGSGVTRSLEDMLAAFAKSNGKRPRLVHRLDRETSGVIVAARTKPAAAHLSEAFAGREVEKAYLAIVCGAPEPQGGEINLALRKSRRRGLDIMEIDSAGQPALTRYRTLASTPEAALLELRPETGRMHQLRAHLAAIGRPIAGDGKYGGLFQIGATSIPRLMLHAAALEFPHPAGGRRQFEAGLPPDIAEPLRSLGLEPTRGPQS
jgi:23S rRNA pseudouridine955/2504/2580 synthase